MIVLSKALLGLTKYDPLYPRDLVQVRYIRTVQNTQTNVLQKPYQLRVIL